MSRWYDDQGNIIDDVDLRQARKLGLLPSNTSIIDAFYSYGLEQWKQRQIINTCYEITPDPFDSEEMYYERIKQESSHRIKTAARLGHAIHDGVEVVLNGNVPIFDIQFP